MLVHILLVDNVLCGRAAHIFDRLSQAGTEWESPARGPSLLTPRRELSAELVKRR